MNDLKNSMNDLKRYMREAETGLFGPHTFVQTSPCGRGERHPAGLVGNLWRIKDPATVQIGHCFMKGRLKKNDLWLCVKHSGDGFQDYIFVEEYQNCLIGKTQIKFGSYGIGDAVQVPLNTGEFEVLKSGGRVEREVAIERARRCTTHHRACDCREYRYQRMEQALKIISTWASVPGCLHAEKVVEVCENALKEGQE